MYVQQHLLVKKCKNMTIEFSKENYFTFMSLI